MQSVGLAETEVEILTRIIVPAIVTAVCRSYRPAKTAFRIEAVQFKADLGCAQSKGVFAGPMRRGEVGPGDYRR